MSLKVRKGGGKDGKKGKKYEGKKEEMRGRKK
jgi:hypothetical protein